MLLDEAMPEYVLSLAQCGTLLGTNSGCQKHTHAPQNTHTQFHLI